MTIVKSFWKRIFNLGITDDLSGEEKKKTRLLNIVALAGFPICITFLIINIFQERPLLVIINLLLALGCLTILFINKEKKYLLGRFFLSIMSMIVFSVAALYYHNGAEYFLILNIVATVILFKKSAYILSLSTANAILFLVIKFLQPYEYSNEVVSQTRVLFNIGWTLLFIIMALHYYKTEHLSYHAQIENTNEQLKEQQKQL
ncbi:MAG TPA: hypothetical protein VF622_13055, partial [Segetibacter sp.]